MNTNLDEYPWKCSNCHQLLKNGNCNEKCGSRSVEDLKMNLKNLEENLKNVREQCLAKSINEDTLKGCFDMYARYLNELSSIVSPNCLISNEAEEFYRSLLSKIFGNKG